VYIKVAISGIIAADCPSGAWESLNGTFVAGGDTPSIAGAPGDPTGCAWYILNQDLRTCAPGEQWYAIGVELDNDLTLSVRWFRVHYVGATPTYDSSILWKKTITCADLDAGIDLPFISGGPPDVDAVASACHVSQP
jgi:hypothetical protein